jgi:uncharacterized protein (TIGR04255 family)
VWDDLWSKYARSTFAQFVAELPLEPKSVDALSMSTDKPSFPTLSSAPIIEALLDVGVANPPSVTSDQLQTLHKKLESDYPKIDKIPFPFLQIGGVGGSGTLPLIPQAPNVRGFRFSAEDDKTMVQSRIDGFTFNNLEPYIDWEFFNERAVAAWREYRNVFSEGPITRVALKYVNLIRCPLENDRVSLEKYFTIAPKAPLGSVFPMSNFLTQVQLEAPDKIQCNLTFTRHLPPEPDFFKVILDIDVSVQDRDVLAEQSVESLLPTLRKLKNELFFNSLTATGLCLFL